MPKFSVYGKVVGTKWIGEYDAPDAEAAIQMAEKDAHSSMCHQCSRECEDPEVEDLVAEELEAPPTSASQ